jgi:hypothetical protein
LSAENTPLVAAITGVRRWVRRTILCGLGRRLFPISALYYSPFFGYDRWAEGLCNNMIRLTNSQMIPAWTSLFCYWFYALTLHGAPSKVVRLLGQDIDGTRPVLAVDCLHPWYGAFRILRRTRNRFQASYSESLGFINPIHRL